MDKRGDADNVLSENLIYIILFILFFFGMLFFVWGYDDGVVLLEDLYVKEISRIIDVSEPGAEVYLDVTKATELAQRKGQSFSSMFRFDNVKNEVIVSLRPGGGKAFSFFNDVDVVDVDLKLTSGDAETNRLYFRIVKSGGDSGK